MNQEKVKTHPKVRAEGGFFHMKDLEGSPSKPIVEAKC